MDDLTAFVKARLDEDEAAANEVHRPRDCGCVDRDGEFDPNPVYCGCKYPARVLREVAAKRAIMVPHRPEALRYIEADRRPTCRAPWPCPAVRHFAAVYSDHADYRAGWAP